MPISKSDIKLIRSLAQKKYRESTGLFVVEGSKMVREALDSSLEVQSVYYTDDIGESEMKKITLLTSPSPALAVVRKPKIDNDLSKVYFQGISLALDSLRDPGNLGTIIRLCDWFGIQHIFASPDTVDDFNPKTVQASMGAILRKRVTYIDLLELIPTYSKHGISVYGTSLDGENIYSEPLNRDNALIVMGSENNGISPEVEALLDNKLYIPPYLSGTSSSSESLNVAIATAIFCYEFRRSR